MNEAGRPTTGTAGAAGTSDTGGALRLFVGALPFSPDAELDLPDGAAGHVKVRRLQPGAPLRLFDGTSGEDWPATVLALTRSGVRAQVGAAPVAAPARELPVDVTLAFGMPANERIDTLVEKATELGVAALVPLITERSVLRLSGERAERRRAHWHAVAAAACEQCGRARVPVVHAVQALTPWLSTPRARPAAAPEASPPHRWLLATAAGTPGLAPAWRQAGPGPAVFLSGPEGGLAPHEEDAARAAGYAAVSLGARVLRADTAPLAALAWLAVELGASSGALQALAAASRAASTGR